MYLKSLIIFSWVLLTNTARAGNPPSPAPQPPSSTPTVNSTGLPASPVRVEIWLRKPGTTSNAAAADSKLNPQSLDMRGLNFDQLKTMDIQYGQEGEYRGMHLRDLIAAYKPLPLLAELVLLHSKNGMVLPVSLPQLRKDRQIFIALEMKRNTPNGEAWTSSFPDSIRPDPNVTDLHPLRFEGAKIVTGTDWRATEGTFTPWRHFDTLVGIEFAEESAWEEQFSAKNPTAAYLKADSGKGVFLARCQFCHSVNGLGAKRAPDLMAAVSKIGTVDGKQVSDKELIDLIYKKVALPKLRVEQLTHAMPEQTTFKKRDARNLIRWLREVNGKEMKGYIPTYTAP